MRPLNFRKPVLVQPQKRLPDMSDGDVLDILDLFEGQGLSMGEIGERYGRSRGAIAGLIKRVRDDLAASESGLDTGAPATKPENRDGALGRRWWEAGLRRRRA
jgi:hypothetical protein